MNQNIVFLIYIVARLQCLCKENIALFILDQYKPNNLGIKIIARTNGR